MIQKPKTTIIGKALLEEKIADNLKRQKMSLTKAQIEIVINELLMEIKKSLIKGEEIRLLGYFTLKTAISKARMAMNLQTGKKINVPAKRVPKVKFSDVLKKEISATSATATKRK